MTPVVVRTINCPSCHGNGRVTYWDPQARAWREADLVPAHALVGLPDDVVARVKRHAWNHHGVYL